MPKQSRRPFTVVRRRKRQPKVPAVKLSADEFEKLIEAGGGAEAKAKRK
jgi:hypothetical protein